VSAAPSITVLLPTYNSAATLPVALDSLAVQDYDGDVDVLVVDGGSTDASRAIAQRAGARVVDNPQRSEEAARALGMREATGDLVLLYDADDELPARDWLRRLVDALGLADDVVAADSLFHEWRRQDPPVTRLCALIGGTDPLAIELGWGDRWAAHLGRWTGMPIRGSEERGDALLVALDPDRPPPMGSNGFLVRRDALLETGFAPSFVHSDVVGDLAAAGWRFARVRHGIVHHYAPTLADYARKARRRARRSIRGEPVQRRGYRPSRGRAVAQLAFSASIVGPAALAWRGFAARRDPAWALYPVLSLITVAAYAEAVLTRLAGR
jgi:glycosyltransferase involved in cell wall biosynthesis